MKCVKRKKKKEKEDFRIWIEKNIVIFIKILFVM